MSGSAERVEVHSLEIGHSDKRTGADRELQTLEVGLSGKWVAASCELRTFELEQRRLDLSELRRANCELFNLGR